MGIFHRVIVNVTKDEVLDKLAAHLNDCSKLDDSLLNERGIGYHQAIDEIVKFVGSLSKLEAPTKEEE